MNATTTTPATCCPHCGSRTGLDCGEAEPDYRGFCSVGCFRAQAAAAMGWLAILPAIPLARAVPFVSGGQDLFGVVVCGGRAIRDDRGGIWDDSEVRKYLRVDLDDPQGFAYALRWFCSQKIGDYSTSEARIRVGTARNAHAATTARIIEHFTRSLWDGPGAITDADRLDLAQAIADMQGRS